MALRNEFHCHIGYRSNPEPPIDLDGLRDEAISARFDEIWADADLLHGALKYAGIPFDLKTASLLRDQAQRVVYGQSHYADDEIDKCIRAIFHALTDAVSEAAALDVDNPCIDFD